MNELLKTWAFCLVFIIIGVVIGYLYPSDYLRLSADGESGISGVLQKRIDGIIPIEERIIKGVGRATLIESTKDIVTDYASTIVLDTFDGDIVYSHMAWVRAEQEVSRINRYIEDPGEHKFSTWRVNWPYFLVSGFLILASLVYGVLQFWQNLQNSTY